MEFVEAPWGTKTVTVLILSCGDFKEFVPANISCCQNCHTHRKEDLIVFTPRRPEDGRPDWTLCVQSEVCCTVYHYVRDIPREWWEKISEEHKVRHGDDRYRTVTHGQSKATGASKAREKKKSKDDPEFSFEDFLNG